MPSAQNPAGWPDPPARPLAARLQGRRAYRLADRLERRLVRRRLGYPFTASRAFRRRDGRLMVLDVDAAATGRSAAETNLDLVAQACERAGIAYFLVPGPNEITARIAVADEQWDELAGALAELAPSGPVYVSPGGRNAEERWPVPVTSPKLAQAIASRHAVAVYRPVATSTTGRLLGRQWCASVERWRTEGRHLVAVERNGRTQSVPRSTLADTRTVRRGREVPTLDVFARPHILDVDFPVDVVYLWVDGDDPDWLARKAAALGTAPGTASGSTSGTGPGTTDATADARFRDGGELKYSMRSLAQYAPWVRRVFLVTDRQVPSWLDRDEPRLTVVDHRELFGDAGTLPTFNSHAIGARLHHIDGLAEHYLYFNDDVFVGRDITPDAFFEASGLSKFFLSRLSLGMTEPEERQSHESARRNVANLVERDFGRSPGNIFYHSPIPQRRSTMVELEARYPDEFRTTLNNQFRSHTDIEPNSWLHHYVGYLLGRAVPAHITYTYIQLGSDIADDQFARLARMRDRDVFCINDHVDATAEQHASAARWLASYFPVPSPFEKKDR